MSWAACAPVCGGSGGSIHAALGNLATWQPNPLYKRPACQAKQGLACTPCDVASRQPLPPFLSLRHKVDTMKKHAQELLDSVLKNPDVTPERIGRVRCLCLIDCCGQWRGRSW